MKNKDWKSWKCFNCKNDTFKVETHKTVSFIELTCTKCKNTINFRNEQEVEELDDAFGKEDDEHIKGLSKKELKFLNKESMDNFN